MVPIIMLIFVIILMVLFIALAFLQKKKEPIQNETILSQKDLEKIKRSEESL